MRLFKKEVSREEAAVDASIAAITSLSKEFDNTKGDTTKIRSASSKLPAVLDQLDLAWEEFSNEFAYRPAPNFNKLQNNLLKELTTLKSSANKSLGKYVESIETKINDLGEGELRHVTGGSADSTADILSRLETNLQNLAANKHLKQLSNECINLNSIANQLHTRIDALLTTKNTLNTDGANGMPRVRDLRNDLLQNLNQIITEVGSKDKILPAAIRNIKIIVSTNPGDGNNSILNILATLDTALNNLEPDYVEIKKLSDQANSMEKDLINGFRLNDDEDSAHNTTVVNLDKLASIKLPEESKSIHSTMNELNKLLPNLSVARNSNDFKNNYSSAIANIKKILIRLRKLLSEEVDTIDKIGKELDKLFNSARTGKAYGYDPTHVSSGLKSSTGDMYQDSTTLTNLIKNERIHFHKLRSIIENDLTNIGHIIDDTITEIRDAHAYDGSSIDDGNHQSNLNDFKTGWNQILQAVKSFEATLNKFEEGLDRFIVQLTATTRFMKSEEYQKAGLTDKQKDLLKELDRDMTVIVNRLSDTHSNGFGKKLYG